MSLALLMTNRVMQHVQLDHLYVTIVFFHTFSPLCCCFSLPNIPLNHSPTHYMFLLCISSLMSAIFFSAISFPFPRCCHWSSPNKETEDKAHLLLSPPPILSLPPSAFTSPFPVLLFFLTSLPFFSSPVSFCHLSSRIYPQRVHCSLLLSLHVCSFSDLSLVSSCL